MAQDLINKTKYNTFFKDISLSFTANPLNNDLVTRKDIDAIRDSVRNIALLNKGECPFHSDIGGDTYQMLFKRFTIAIKSVFENNLTRVVSKYEPRVINVEASIDRTNPNTLELNISFLIVGSAEQQFLSITVNRNN